jgi:hypothetical protein
MPPSPQPAQQLTWPPRTARPCTYFTASRAAYLHPQVEQLQQGQFSQVQTGVHLQQAQLAALALLVSLVFMMIALLSLYEFSIGFNRQVEHTVYSRLQSQEDFFEIQEFF